MWFGYPLLIILKKDYITLNNRICLILKYPLDVQLTCQHCYAVRLLDRHRNWSTHWCVRFLYEEFSRKTGNSNSTDGSHLKSPAQERLHLVGLIIFSLLLLGSFGPSTIHISLVWTIPMLNCCCLWLLHCWDFQVMFFLCQLLEVWIHHFLQTAERSWKRKRM